MVLPGGLSSRSIGEMLLRGSLTGFLLAVALHVSVALANGNFQSVLPGQVYRSGQLRASSLDALVRKHGIRTVVNLRGCCSTAEWYREEARVAHNLGISLENVNFSASRLPSVISIRQLVDIIDRSEPPLLFHCHQGADRTGLAVVLFLLLRTPTPLSEALPHLGLATGHLSVGKTGNVDRFFTIYKRWLRDQELSHSPDLMRTWIREHYKPGEASAKVVLLDRRLEHSDGKDSIRVPKRKTTLLLARCTNTSDFTWNFTPDTSAGIHVWWSVLDRQEQFIQSERTGLFRRRVAPGESIDVEVPLPPLEPGIYELRLDLADEQQGHFLQMGNNLYVVEVRVE